MSALRAIAIAALLCLSAFAQNPPRGLLVNRPAPCDAGDEYFATDNPVGQQMTLCISQNTWDYVAPSSSGVSFSGTVIAGAPVVGLTGSTIASLTAANACTTGFSGLQPAICTAIVQPTVTGATSGVLRCGGAICPAGHYGVSVYAVITGGTSGNPSVDVVTGWTDPSSAAQTYDYGNASLAASSACSNASGIGCFVSADAPLRSNGNVDISYSTNVTSGLGTSVYYLSVVLTRLN